MIARSGGRIRVPELGLQQLTTGRIEATGVRYDSRILTAELRVGACCGGTSEYRITCDQGSRDKG